MLSSPLVRILAQALGAILCFATIPTAVRLISADPITIGLVRLIIAVSIGYFILLKIDSLRQLTRRDWLWLGAIGLSFGVHWYLYFLSIKLATASTAVVGVSSYGVQIILISIIFHGRPIYKTDILAVLAVLAGTLTIIPEFSMSNDVTKGLLVAIISAFFYAILPSFHQKNAHINGNVRSFGQFMFAGLFFAVLFPYANFDLPAFDWIGLLYLGVICTLIGHTLWIQVVTQVSAVAASLMYYLSVPLAILMSVLVLNEPLTLNLMVGTALILAGNCLGLFHQIKSRSFWLVKTVE